ncbi:MAG: LysM peptidoglycan-binding domain-containing protein, partial [Gammaproteobacteria bacterium]
DFWSLKVPRQTALYVPRLLAAAEMVASPDVHGIDLIDVPDAAYFEVLSLDRSLTLEQAAKLSRVDWLEVRMLNAGYLAGVTVASGGMHRLLVPVNRGNVLLARLSATGDYGSPSAGLSLDGSWRRHRIQPGESLSGIAQRYRTSVTVLRAANRISGSYIRAGSSLLVPAGNVDDTTTTSTSATTRTHLTSARIDAAGPVRVSTTERSALLEARLPATGAYSNRLDYRVRTGDCLWDIAERFRVTVRQLRQWNELGSQRFLRPGQVLAVYVRPPQQT